LKLWRPRELMIYSLPGETAGPPPAAHAGPSAEAHAAEAAALMAAAAAPAGEEKPLNAGNVALAWAPYALMSVLLFLTGLVRQDEGRTQGPAWSLFGGLLHQAEGPGPVWLGPVQTNYMVPI